MAGVHNRRHEESRTLGEWLAAMGMADLRGESTKVTGDKDC